MTMPDSCYYSYNVAIKRQLNANSRPTIPELIGSAVGLVVVVAFLLVVVLPVDVFVFFVVTG